MRTALIACSLAAAAVCAGCTPRERGPGIAYMSKPAAAPPVKYCCDSTGHQARAKPIVLGGTCCCTPTPDLVAKLHRDGMLKDYTAARLQSAYASQDITTDNDHRGCNNRCSHGPHVVKGGHCLATPTLGTLNYEEVVSGEFDPPRVAEEKPREK